MKISNKNFIIIVIIFAILSGIIWGMPFNKPIGNKDWSLKDGVAVFILENGPFVKSEIFDSNIERIFYPVFLAGAYKIFGRSQLVGIMINIFVFVGLVFLIYKLCQSVINERLARLASFITAICYTLASYVGWFSREIFFVFLVFLLIYFLYKAQKEDKSIWFILSGIIFGMAVLTNAVIQLFIWIIIANFLFLNIKNLKKIVPKLILFFLAFVLFVSPWLITNYLYFGRTPFFSKQGFIFAIKVEKMYAIEGKYVEHLIANTTGDFFAQKFFSDYDKRESRQGWETIQEWDKGDKELDYKHTRESLKEFVKHPIMFLKMASLDFLKFNTPMVPDVRMQHMFAEPGSHSELSDFTKGAIILSIRFIYLIFAILIIYAMAKNIKKWDKIGWIILIIVYFNLIFGCFHAIARYSLPVYPFYIILLSMGLLIVWDKIISSKYR
ncbi:ArnT family glycosyltransferase [Patescibacteria group bacterium]